MTGTDEADIFYLDQDNQTASGGLGLDNYIVGRSFDHAVIDDMEEAGKSSSDDILRFTSLKPADVTVTREGIDIVMTVTATGQTLRIKNEFEPRIPGIFGGNFGPDGGVTQVVFADGTVWSRFDLSWAAATHPDDASTVVTGTDAPDVINGGKGNDTLRGGGDGDLYLFNRGDGQDLIEDNETNVLRNDGLDVLASGYGEIPSGVSPAVARLAKPFDQATLARAVAAAAAVRDAPAIAR
ncbi:calcium-binding protein [Methylobacterium sp. JK268]